MRLRHRQCRLYKYPLFFIFHLFAAMTLLAGCCTTATHEGMTPLTFENGAKHRKSVSVIIEGGKELDELGRPQISNAELKKALINSIIKSETFSQVVEGKGGDFLLTLSVFTTEQPVIGFSLTVKIEVGWTLVRIATGEKVWQEAFKSEHTATTEDAFFFATRLRLATEGAARNNISQALSKISKLSL